MNDGVEIGEVEVEFSPSIAKLSKALVLAQTAMGGAVKGKDNPFFNSKYADLAEVIAAVKDPLNSNGVCFMQPVVGSSEKSVRVATLFLHESGEWMKASASFPAVKADPQAFGSAVSYARRYTLQSFLSVPSEDDDGNKASGKKESSSAAMTQDFPPNTPLFGLLKQLIPADGTKPAIAMIEMDGVGTLGFDLLKGEAEYRPLLNRLVEFQYGKNGKFRPITSMVLAPTAPQAPLKSVPGPTRTLPPKHEHPPTVEAVFEERNFEQKKDAFAAQYSRGLLLEVQAKTSSKGEYHRLKIMTPEEKAIWGSMWHSPGHFGLESFDELIDQDIYYRYSEGKPDSRGNPFINWEEVIPADVFDQYCGEKVKEQE